MARKEEFPIANPVFAQKMSCNRIVALYKQENVQCFVQYLFLVVSKNFFFTYNVSPGIAKLGVDFLPCRMANPLKIWDETKYLYQI